MKRLLFAISCLALSAISGAQVAVISDDFNRPDGPVGNGWSVWNGSDITSGQLRTFGANGLGGGVYRPSTIGLPLKLSFDFRTESTSFQCGSGSFNDGGWAISLNTLTGQGFQPAQVRFIHYSGQRNIVRDYWNGTSMVSDSGPVLEGPVGDLRDYSATFSHITGVVNADLTATITILYGDGNTPDPVVVAFATPPIDAQPLAGGDQFRLSNANCSGGPHFFDNIVVEPAPQPTFEFTGFFQPVDNPPTRNTMNAGAAVPIRFSLNGNQGLSIFADGYPKSQLVQCSTGDPLADIEETMSPGASALSYDDVSDRYTYVWKTDKTWARSCRELLVRLTDGTTHSAIFNFRK